MYLGLSSVAKAAMSAACVLLLACACGSGRPQGAAAVPAVIFEKCQGTPCDFSIFKIENGKTLLLNLPGLPIRGAHSQRYAVDDQRHLVRLSDWKEFSPCDASYRVSFAANNTLAACIAEYNPHPRIFRFAQPNRVRTLNVELFVNAAPSLGFASGRLVGLALDSRHCALNVPQYGIFPTRLVSIDLATDKIKYLQCSTSVITDGHNFVVTRNEADEWQFKPPGSDIWINGVVWDYKAPWILYSDASHALRVYPSSQLLADHAFDAEFL